MGPDAPAQPPTRRAQLYTALGTGAVLAGGLAYIGVNDPHRPGSIFPPCPFHALTGWFCPGCGGLRMTHDLLHGDIAAAAVDNVFLLVALPAVLLWVWLRRRSRKPIWTTFSVVFLVVAAVVWTVVRNLPGFPLVPTVLGG
ncbi:MAG: DUF2752 domain-containing protein [Mycobacterium sp.]